MGHGISDFAGNAFLPVTMIGFLLHFRFGFFMKSKVAEQCPSFNQLG